MNGPIIAFVAIGLFVALAGLFAATYWIDRRKPPVPANYDTEGA